MAMKATIFKADIQLSDLDHHFYRQLTLRLARHPSETDQRLTIRLVAFVLNAWQEPSFTRGLSTEDEPDLWARNYSDEIELWIDVGLPDERRIRKACSRAKAVHIYAYGKRNAPVWRQQEQKSWARFEKLTISHFAPATCSQLELLTARNMQLQATLQDGELWLGDNTHSVHVVPERWYPNAE
jgi:uncharacterized protein YaeQ